VFTANGAVMEERNTRPATTPPADDAHEFFTKWLPINEGVFQRWQAWFIERRVPCRVVTKRLGPWEVGMIYVHKCQSVGTGAVKGSSRHTGVIAWCCQGQEPAPRHIADPGTRKAPPEPPARPLLVPPGRPGQPRIGRPRL